MVVGLIARRAVPATRDRRLDHDLAGRQHDVDGRTGAIPLHPGRRHRSAHPAASSAAEVPLVEVPAQGGGGVHDGHAGVLAGIDPRQELVDPVDVVPRPVRHDQVEGRPVCGRDRSTPPPSRRSRAPRAARSHRPVVVEVREVRRGGEGHPWPARKACLAGPLRRSSPDREVAGHLVARRQVAQFGHLLGAAGLGPRAAGAEPAPRGRVDRARRLAPPVRRRPRAPRDPARRPRTGARPCSGATAPRRGRPTAPPRRAGPGTSPRPGRSRSSRRRGRGR